MKKLNLSDLQKRKYLENLKLFSKIRSEKSSAYIYLMATFISLSVLVLFAIGPTLSTIVELQKKLEDSKMADSALATKIQSMNSLQSQYNELSPDLPLISSALPNTPIVTDFLGRTQAIAANSNVSVVSLTSTSVPILLSAIPEVSDASDPSFVFSLSVEGNYTDTLTFFQKFANFDRVISVTTFSITRDAEERNSPKRTLTIEGRAYFKQ